LSRYRKAFKTNILPISEMTTHIARKIANAYLPLVRKADSPKIENPTQAAIFGADFQLSRDIPVEVPGGIVYDHQKSFDRKTFSDPEETMLIGVAGSISSYFLQFAKQIQGEDGGLKKFDFAKDLKKGHSPTVQSLNLSAMSQGIHYNTGGLFNLTVAHRDCENVRLYAVGENGVVAPMDTVVAGSGGPHAQQAYEVLTSDTEFIPSYCSNVLAGELFAIYNAVRFATSKDRGSLGIDVHVITPDKITNVTDALSEKKQAFGLKEFKRTIRKLDDLVK